MNSQKLNIKKSILNALKLNLCGCKSSKMINRNKNNDYEFVSYQPITVVSPSPSIEIKRSTKLVKQNGQTNLQPFHSYKNYEFNELTCDELNLNNETCMNRFHSTKLDNLKDTKLNFQETIQEEEQKDEEKEDEETFDRYILITTQLEQEQQENNFINQHEENESLYDDYLEQIDYDLIFKSISQKQRNMKLTSTIIKQQSDILIKNGYQTTATPKNNQQEIKDLSKFTNYDSTFSTANSTFEDQTYSARYSTINSSCDTTLTNSSSSDESSFDFSQKFNFESTRNNQIENNMNEIEESLFICVSDYKAKLSGDLNLNLNDKVKIIYNNKNKSPATTNNFILVQLIESNNKYQQENIGQYGFVPRKCIRKF
jgi:hypothetical protein